jgi:hypothetical protein
VTGKGLVIFRQNATRYFIFHQRWVVKVRFCQNVLMFLSYPQTDEHFTFLNWIWILVIYKAVLASQMRPFLPLQASKLSNFKTFSISRQFSVTKTQIFKFRKIKCSSVWSYDKNISIFWQKRNFRWWPRFRLSD